MSIPIFIVKLGHSYLILKGDEMVRCKMRCDGLEASIDASQEPNGGTVRLNPVVNGSEENKNFFKYTPGGTLVLSTINQAAFSQFTLGSEYYVDVTPANVPESGS